MKAQKQISLTNNEWRIMEHLWQNAPLTIMQIVHLVETDTGWAPSTIKTMISRMENKGAIYYQEGGKAKLCYPATDRSQVAVQETKTLLNKVFNGNVGIMMSALIEQQQLSASEINQLRQILAQAEGKK
ncbi:MAG: BlaI/MecI/CopY family transcriptional regulator [Clostridiales bacterium]